MSRLFSFKFLPALALISLASACSTTPEEESEPKVLGYGFQGSELPTNADAPAPPPDPPVGSTGQTQSGLEYKVMRMGSGKRPSRFSTVRVNYHGYLTNGEVFDTTLDDKQPVDLPLNRVIPGWQQGIPLMREGAIYRFRIPPHLAYGQRGAPPHIGPNETLMFDIELLEVIN